MFHRSTKSFRPKQGGFVAFTSILVISAIAVTIVVSSALLGIGEAGNSLGYKKGQETLKFAEGCVEEALLRLKDDPAYVNGSLSLNNSSCTITVSGSGSNRTIEVTAITAGPPQYQKKIVAQAKRTGRSVNLTGWQEQY